MQLGPVGIFVWGIVARLGSTVSAITRKARLRNNVWVVGFDDSVIERRPSTPHLPGLLSPGPARMTQVTGFWKRPTGRITIVLIHGQGNG